MIILKHNLIKNTIVLSFFPYYVEDRLRVFASYTTAPVTFNLIDDLYVQCIKDPIGIDCRKLIMNHPVSYIVGERLCRSFQIESITGNVIHSEDCCLTDRVENEISKTCFIVLNE